MFVYAAAASVIAALAGLSQQLFGVTDPKFTGPEYLAAGATNMAGDGATALGVGARLAAEFINNPDLFATSPGDMDDLDDILKPGDEIDGASIILWTLAFVDSMELLMGFWLPTEGDDLKSGSEQFTRLYGLLGAALPDDRWQGDASKAYAAENAALQDLAKAIAGLDRQLADAVKQQADMVTKVRFGMGILKDLLAAAHIIELVIMSLGDSSGSFAIIVSGLGVTAAVTMLGFLATVSRLPADKADKLAAKYEKPAADLVPAGTWAQVEAAAAAQSGVSSHEALSGSMSGGSAVPELARLADADSGSADERVAVSALTTGDESRGFGTAGQSLAAATAPVLTMPTLAQVTQLSGQAAKLSGHASQRPNLANQTLGQLQEIASMAQRDRGMAGHGEHAGLAGDVEGTGAGLGTDATEPAPVRFAAIGAKQAQEPSALGPMAPLCANR